MLFGISGVQNKMFESNSFNQLKDFLHKKDIEQKDCFILARNLRMLFKTLRNPYPSIKRFTIS